MTGRRADEVAGGLARVRDRIDAACASAGRSTRDVTLVVVTKFFPATDVRILHDLGVTDVGENRHQEAEAKRQECADLALRWHFIGHLQSNKAAAVGGWADVVQSVDRRRLLNGLGKAAQQRDAELDVLVQVSLDPAGAGSGRSGAAPGDAVALALEATGAAGLRLRGVMGVAPLGGSAFEAFERLAAVSAQLRKEVPTATWVSAGMSGDLEQAIAAGATHVRVGSAVLGNRPAPR